MSLRTHRMVTIFVAGAVAVNLSSCVASTDFITEEDAGADSAVTEVIDASVDVEPVRIADADIATDSDPNIDADEVIVTDSDPDGSDPDGDIDALPDIELSTTPGEFEVTEAEWEAVMGRRAVCPDCPVVNVSITDVMVYAVAASRAERLQPCYVCSDDGTSCFPKRDYFSCRGYRLPTSEEWSEFARANDTSDAPTPIEDYAWFDRTVTQSVGQLLPNNAGLYDTLGNAWEWVYDGAYPSVACGGGFDTTLEEMTNGYDICTEFPSPIGRSNVGFRLVR